MQNHTHSRQLNPDISFSIDDVGPDESATVYLLSSNPGQFTRGSYTSGKNFSFRARQTGHRQVAGRLENSVPGLIFS